LIEQGIPEEKLKELETSCRAKMEEAYAKSKDLKITQEDWMTEEWAEIKDDDFTTMTGVEETLLDKIGQEISVLPTDGKFHNNIVKIFKERNNSITEKTGIDWGTAEALAFATLVDKGYHVRLSGQDVERGTFSHRHAHVFY
jgi:2-oxoglutarate dehydrogenase E1 component